MFHRIRERFALHNDRLRLESMSDRLLADIGVERAEINDWLRGETFAETRNARPLTLRLRSAATAFVRELRVESAPGHPQHQSQGNSSAAA